MSSRVQSVRDARATYERPVLSGAEPVDDDGADTIDRRRERIDDDDEGDNHREFDRPDPS